MILKETASAKTMNTGEYLFHRNVYGSGKWAGTSPTVGSCGFYDYGADDWMSSCNVESVSGDIRIQPEGTTFLELNPGDGGGQQGFWYQITTDSDATSTSDSYLNVTIDANSQNSSKISITQSSNVPELSDYAILLILITVVGGFFAMKR